MFQESKSDSKLSDCCLLCTGIQCNGLKMIHFLQKPLTLNHCFLGYPAGMRWQMDDQLAEIYPVSIHKQNPHRISIKCNKEKAKENIFFHKRLSFFINFPSYFLDTYHVQSFSFLQATMTQSARKIDWFRGIGNENRLFSCKIKSLIWAFGRSHSSSSLPPSLSFYFGN